MKRTCLLFSFVLFSLFGYLFAQQLTDVKLRYSEQGGSKRIVLEGKEAFIQNARVITEASQITIEFSEQFTLAPQKDIPFGISLKDKVLKLILKEESSVKFFRLSSPPRLVFDIQNKALLADKQPSIIILNSFVIDAGHGGYDFGINSGKSSEKEVSLTLVRSLGRSLANKKKKVLYTRKVDQYVSLADRISLVNKERPDIFLSFHSSLSENFVILSPKYEDQGQDSQSIVEYYSISNRQRKYTGKSKALADSLEKAIEEEFQTDAVRREMPLPILNAAGAPCVLIEFPSPKFLVYDKQMTERITASMQSGIAAYGLRQLQMDITR